MSFPLMRRFPSLMAKKVVCVQFSPLFLLKQSDDFYNLYVFLVRSISLPHSKVIAFSRCSYNFPSLIQLQQEKDLLNQSSSLLTKSLQVLTITLTFFFFILICGMWQMDLSMRKRRKLLMFWLLQMLLQST